MADLIVVVAVLAIVVGLLGLIKAKFIDAKSPAVPAPDSNQSSASSSAASGAAAGAGGAAGGAGGAAGGAADSDAGLFPLHIFVGSQTGTAEGFAKQIANEARGNGFKPTIVDLEEFEPEMLNTPQPGSDPRRLSIFLMATYGEGDPTDNAADFIKYLKNDERTPTEMSSVHYCVFGLGNRQYEHYNAMGKFVNTRMTELGASAVYKYGEGDDDGTLDEDFEAWRDDLWDGIKKDFAIEGAAASGAAAGGLPPFEWNLVWVATPDEDVQARILSDAAASCDPHHLTMASRSFFTAKPVKVTVNRELRQAPGEFDSTKHIELDLRGSNLKYKTADDLAVLPENPASVVNRVAKWLDFDLDRWFTLEPVDVSSNPKPLFPTPCTVRTALTQYCDLNGLPNKQFLKYMMEFAGNAEERARLAELTSRDNKAAFHSWVTEAQRSIFEVFQEFSSVKPDFGQLVQLLPPLAVRYYTICSSSVVHPNNVHLAVSIIKQPKPGSDTSRVFSGVCSNYLANLPVEERKSDDEVTIRCDVRASNFKLPKDPSVPVIMVGPGTGIAPMRAFLQERRFQQESGADLGPTVLFFGCRRSDTDYIYKDELQSYVDDHTLTNLYTAFSREQEQKVYVQHRMTENGEQVWDLLHKRGGSIYVCGATSMGKDVHEALVNIGITHGHLPRDQAVQVFEDLIHSERYIQELWS